MFLLTETKKSDINNVTMYRNGWSMREIKQISSFIYKLQNEVEIECLLKELLTNSEINVLSKRWRMMPVCKWKTTLWHSSTRCNNSRRP